MKTEDLIADLASRARPVRPLPPPALRALAWSIVAILSAAGAILLFGPKADLDIVVDEPVFVVTALLALATTVVAVAASLVLAVPGAERSPALRGASVALVSLWLVTLSVGIIRAGDGFAAASTWPVCFLRAVGVGLLPAAVLVGMLRRAAPLRLAWTAALAAMAAMAIGALAVQMVCPHNEAAHALLGHFGPVLAFCGMGAGAARRLLTAPPRGA